MNTIQSFTITLVFLLDNNGELVKEKQRERKIMQWENDTNVKVLTNGVTRSADFLRNC